jgi:hypothetical protein
MASGPSDRQPLWFFVAFLLFAGVMVGWGVYDLDPMFFMCGLGLMLVAVLAWKGKI